MNSRYKELGAGYAYSSSRQSKHFWTQDFGGGTATEYKIPAGCHFTPKSSTISFAANYYDNSGSAPTSATVVIDSDVFPMTLLLGKSDKGTYSYTMTNDKLVHCYHFVFTDDSGAEIRFPETVRLTTGTTICCEKNSTSIDTYRFSKVRKGSFIHVQESTNFYNLNGTKITGKLRLYYASGIHVSGETNKTQSTQRSIVK